MDIILNTFGVSINCEKGCFVIRNREGEQKIPVEGIKTIVLCKGAQITTDAIFLAIENEIDILFNDRSGKPAGRIWSPKYGSISTIRKGQLNFIHTKEAFIWIREVIIKKIENQQALISMMPTPTQAHKHHREKAIARLQEYVEKIQLLEAESITEVSSQLRGWEGASSKIYFEAINYFVPEHYKFNGRSQRPAKDVFNVLLNYGYGMLYGKVEGALIKAGIDPYIGILHRDEYNRPVLAYDVIENFRVWIDYVVYNIIQQNIITEEFYSVREDGSYWLENLGRRVIIQSINEYLEDTITVKGLSRSRSTHLQLYAQDLAQLFKQNSKV